MVFWDLFTGSFFIGRCVCEVGGGGNRIKLMDHLLSYASYMYNR